MSIHRPGILNENHDKSAVHFKVVSMLLSQRLLRHWLGSHMLCFVLLFVYLKDGSFKVFDPLSPKASRLSGQA